MKPIVFFISLLTVLAGRAQDPVGSYTSGSVNSATAAPGQPNTQYNGTNPAGQPNQINNYSVTVPSSTGTNPVNPTNVSPAVPNTTYPTSPGTPTTNFVQRLYQNPMRTPKNPRVEPSSVKTVDGSTGKYRSRHKIVPAKKNGFVTNRRTRGVKPRVSREKTASR